MIMKSGERWQAINPACGCTMVVEANGQIEGKNPPVQRRQPSEERGFPAVFRSLDFLKFSEPALAPRDTPKD